MRDYGDRESNGRERWDQGIPQIALDTRAQAFRLVGPVQDIAVHWAIQEAGAFADKIADLKREARDEGVEFKRPRDPKGVPFLCPKYDLYREKFVDWWDPDTGEGFFTNETLGYEDLKRQGVPVPKGLVTLAKKKPKTVAALRFSPKSKDRGRPVKLVKAECAMHDDFKLFADTRTWWHAFKRPLAAKGDKGRRGRPARPTGPQELGIVGNRGLPYTAMLQVKRFSDQREVNPADPKHGFDLVFSMDKKLPAQQMYHVGEARDADEHPLTREEMDIALGRYQLKDGSKIRFPEVLKRRRNDPESLKGMKTIIEAGIWPLEELARAATDGKRMKEFMIQQGYYDADGNPRKELKGEKKGKKKDDDADSAWSDSGDADEDEKPRRSRRGRDDEDDDAPARKPSKKPKKPSRDEDEDDEPPRRTKPKPGKPKPSSKPSGKKPKPKPGKPQRRSLIEDED